MAITYTVGFQHDDWIDNVDRVQAGGNNGINIRFHRLETEFQKIAAVVVQISTALDAINAALANLTVKPPPQDFTASLAPALLPTTGIPWSAAIGRVEKAPNAVGGHGWMAVSLPDKSVLNSLTAIGRNTGVGALAVTLRRQALQGANPPLETLLEADNNGGGAFSAVSAPHPANPLDPKFVVDNQNFKYLLVIDLDSAAAGDSVSVTSVQISYTVGRSNA
jgi:hypothetical protein